MRLWRFSVLGPAMSSSFVRFDSGMSSRAAIRAHEDVASGRSSVARCSGFACSTTSYSSPSTTYVVTCRSLIIVWSVEPMLRAVTPRLAARSVSTRTSTCGCVSRRSESSRSEARILGRARDDDVAPARELVVVRAAEHELHGRSAAATATAALPLLMNALTRTSGISSHCLLKIVEQVLRARSCARPTA